MNKELIKEVNQIAQDLLDEVVFIRRYLHQYPEVSYHEHHTSSFIYTELLKIPFIEISRPTPTSVFAILKGDQEGKVLAIRSDIDALPIQETNEVLYQSKNIGVMHACGHDGHIAMLIGTIKGLVRLKHLITGEIRFIFQHAEEKHPGGACEVISSGVLNGVQMILAAHLWVPLEVGSIGLKEGELMAAPDNFDISILGKGGHAGLPQEVIDPIFISAKVISGLQAIVSRWNIPLHPLVLSITSIHGGNTYNIIPEKVELKGTVRSYQHDSRNDIAEAMEQIIHGICTAFGARYDFRYEPGYEPVVNDVAITKMISNVINQALEDVKLIRVEPVMGGEDFSAYLQEIPGAMLFIGAGNQEKGIAFPHHHPRFDIDEASLLIGMKAILFSALRLLAE